MGDRTWTASELQDLACQHGYRVSARKLERWHKADVLPRPIQDAHVSKGTRSYYPPGTDAYLLAVCRLKAAGKGRPLWRLRFELWWEGFAIPIDRVRESLEELLTPTYSLANDAAEFKRALDELPSLDEGRTRRGLAAHLRQALKDHPFEAEDLMTLVLGLAAGEHREINEPIDRAVGPRTFEDALRDVLYFAGTRDTIVVRESMWGEGVAKALHEVSALVRGNPATLLAGISEDRLLAARDAASGLHSALPAVARALRQLTGKDMAGLRLVRQAFPGANDPATRAELVLLFASTVAFDAVQLNDAVAMFSATGRRYAAMQRVLDAIPESRILNGGVEAFAALPLAEQNSVTERVQTFLASHPEVAAELNDG